jgi:hypothetical protein
VKIVGEDPTAILLMMVGVITICTSMDPNGIQKIKSKN